MPFEKGKSGNPAGRPKGSRHKLAESLIGAFARDFEAHGPAAIERVRQEEPGTYLKVAASIIPKELTIAVEQNVRVLTDDELAGYLQEGSGTGIVESPAGPQGDSAVH